MFEFLKKKPSQSMDTSSTPPSALPPHSDLRRELIRVVLKDTLRRHGIPFHWLACEVIIIPRGPGEEELHIQLVILKWHDQLLQYAQALQQQLLLGLERFDPSVDHSQYMVSWRLSPDCDCPAREMPAPGFWLQQATAPVPDAPLSLLDRRKTPRKSKTGAVVSTPTQPPAPAPAMFSPTQMTPLR